MKKISTILLLIVFSSIYIHAQNYNRFTEVSEAYTSIIRSYPLVSHAEVAYTFDENSGYIELRKGGAITGRVPVPLDYKVKDMKLYYNLLYFCGEHRSMGFIAVANLNDIFSYLTIPNSPSTTTIFYTDISIYPYREFVSSLEKLVVYKDADDPFPLYCLNHANEHVVAIGRNKDNPAYPEWHTVHIKYNTLVMGTPPAYPSNYVSIEVLCDISSPSNEQLQEVLLTDDYVALVSYRYSTDEYILHRCEKYNIANTFPPIYKYNAPQYEALSLIKGVAMEDNHIAVATLAAEDPIAGTFGIRIRNINLATMLMTNSQVLFLGEQKQDVEMAYNENKRKIVLMMYYLFNGNQYDMHSFFEIDPWTSFSYQSNAMYDITPTHYNSIYHSNGSYFIAASGNKWFRKNLPIAEPPNDCFNQDNLYAYPVSTKVGHEDNIEFIIKECQPFATAQQVPIETVSITTECSTFEQ